MTRAAEAALGTCGRRRSSQEGLHEVSREAGLAFGLVCLHGCYAPGYGGLRLIFSADGGHTWIAPAKDHGFLVDHCYGYGKAMELADGSLFVVNQGTGGHSAQDAKSMSLRCLRVRIRPDHSGVDLLPAPNR